MRVGLRTVLAAALLYATSASAADYAVRYEGAPAEVAGKLELLTNLSLARRSYPTLTTLRRAAAADVDIIQRALTAAGYFDASISFRIEPGVSASGIPTVIFGIEPGARFQIARHVIIYDDDGSTERPATFEEAGIDLDARADGATLEKNQQRLLEYLWREGYPGAQNVARRADARLAEQTADAVYTVASGARLRYGGIEVVGAKRTKPTYLERLRTWEDGAYFNRAELVDYREELAATGLFTLIEVDAGTANANGAAPVRISVEERKPRTIGAGVSYSTSEGPGGRLFLEYRNVAGRGERARAEIDATEVRQAITFDINRPLPRFPGATFTNFSFINDTTDAFTARSLEIGAGLSKLWLDDRLETRAGLALETSRIESRLRIAPGFGDERTYLVSVPLSATWDTEDDPLSLSSGENVSLFLVPYVGTDQFTRMELVGRSRRQFGNNDRFTLAGRVRVAATAGSGLRALPVNKRVFAGGGSSVRGYDFQSVGPLDPDSVPIGGRSAVEGAVEARAKIFGPLQFAAFVDAGAVYSESFPDFVGDYLVGAGAGARYLSPIGPIRLDVAFPLERRPSDRSFQFYISLGQPF